MITTCLGVCVVLNIALVVCCRNTGCFSGTLISLFNPLLVLSEVKFERAKRIIHSILAFFVLMLGRLLIQVFRRVHIRVIRFWWSWLVLQLLQLFSILINGLELLCLLLVRITSLVEPTLILLCLTLILLLLLLLEFTLSFGFHHIHEYLLTFLWLLWLLGVSLPLPLLLIVYHIRSHFDYLDCSLGPHSLLESQLEVSWSSAELFIDLVRFCIINRGHLVWMLYDLLCRCVSIWTQTGWVCSNDFQFLNFTR